VNSRAGPQYRSTEPQWSLFGPPVYPVYPPWRIWEALGVVVLFAVAQVLVALGVVGVMRRVWPDIGQNVADVPQLQGVVIPVALLVSHAVGWLALLLVIRGRYGLPFVWALRLYRVARRLFARAFLGGMLAQVVLLAVAAAFPPPTEHASPLEQFADVGRWALAMLFVVAVILAPLLEEAMFRGTLYPALRRRWGVRAAALIVTALFTALHATQTGSYAVAIVGIAAVGLVLVWLREGTGNLWPPIAFHMGFNFTAFLPLLLGEPPQV